MKKIILALLLMCQGVALAGMTIDRSYPAQYGNGNVYYPQQTTNSFYVPEPQPIRMFTLEPTPTNTRTYLEYNGSERVRSCTETNMMMQCY